MYYVTVIIEASHAISLGFAAWTNVGFGSQGEAVVQKKDVDQLHKYQIQQGGTYDEIWNKSLSPHFTEGSRTAISSSGVILAQDMKEHFILGFTSMGEVLNVWNYGGLFLACLPSTSLNFVYGRYFGYENCFVFLLELLNLRVFPGGGVILVGKSGVNPRLVRMGLLR